MFCHHHYYVPPSLFRLPYHRHMSFSHLCICVQWSSALFSLCNLSLKWHKFPHIFLLNFIWCVNYWYWIVPYLSLFYAFVLLFFLHFHFHFLPLHLPSSASVSRNVVSLFFFLVKISLPFMWSINRRCFLFYVFASEVFSYFAFRNIRINLYSNNQAKKHIGDVKGSRKRDKYVHRIDRTKSKRSKSISQIWWVSMCRNYRIDNEVYM